MKTITADEANKLSQLTQDCPDNKHEWVEVNAKRYIGRFILCGKCGVNKNWFDNK